LTRTEINQLFANDPKANYFKCLRCGDCCKTSDIPITVLDIFRLAHALHKKEEDVISEFCRLGYHPCPKGNIVTDDMLGVVFIFKDKPCKFFSNDTLPTCTIYEARPIVCENTPNPYNPWSILHMLPSCRGLQASQLFHESKRKYYHEICNLHARTMSLTARFFLDTLGLGQPLNKLQAKFGKTPDTIVTSGIERNTYEVIEILENTVFDRLQAHYDVMKETIKVFKKSRDIIILNVNEILSKTISLTYLRKRFQACFQT
jgi:Fe-S-cluster containining protein